jgi:hypothetical protein
MAKQKILYICGSLNQTTQMHQISKELQEYDGYFAPYFPDGYGYIAFVTNAGLLDMTILGGQAKKRTLNYLRKNNLNIDENGTKHDYDLVYTCSDLLIQKSIRDKKIILVQEGMTDPENFIYYLVKNFRLPRWIASTSVTGLSYAYDKFCVASAGYKELFINKGVDPEKLEVTGIPNFDNCKEFLNNDFPYHNFVLVATSDMRETYKYENRKKFIQKAYRIADGRQLIFKLHPNENYRRAATEIEKYAPGSIVLQKEIIEPMIANCDVLITRYSTVVYVGLALGKEVHSDFEINELKRLLPIQNNGRSAFNIAQVGHRLLAESEKEKVFSMFNNPYKNVTLKERFKIRRTLAKVKH